MYHQRQPIKMQFFMEKVGRYKMTRSVLLIFFVDFVFNILYLFFWRQCILIYFNEHFFGANKFWFISTNFLLSINCYEWKLQIFGHGKENQLEKKARDIFNATTRIITASHYYFFVVSLHANWFIIHHWISLHVNIDFDEIIVFCVYALQESWCE